MPRELIYKYGDIVGLWKILHAVRKKGSSHLFYLCICKCGTERTVKAENLRLGLTKGCGCKNKSFIPDKSNDQ